MKLKIGLIGIAIAGLFIRNANAQSISSEVVGTSGGNTVLPTLQVDWTLGEVFVADVSTSTVLLTQGFHQANPYFLGVSESRKEASFLFPNPAKNSISLRNGNHTSIKTINIRSQIGQLVKVISTENKQSLQFDISELTPGVYFFGVEDIKGSIQTFKFIKLK